VSRDGHGGRTFTVDGRHLIVAKHALARYRERTDDPDGERFAERMGEARWAPNPPSYFWRNGTSRPLAEGGFVVLRDVGVLPLSIEIEGSSGKVCLVASTFVAAP
jgi:hypothetical protein